MPAPVVLERRAEAQDAPQRRGSVAERIEAATVQLAAAVPGRRGDLGDGPTARDPGDELVRWRVGRGCVGQLLLDRSERIDRRAGIDRRVDRPRPSARRPDQVGHRHAASRTTWAGTPSTAGRRPGSNRSPTTRSGPAPSCTWATRSGPATISRPPSQSRSMQPSGSTRTGPSWSAHHTTAPGSRLGRSRYTFRPRTGRSSRRGGRGPPPGRHRCGPARRRPHRGGCAGGSPGSRCARRRRGRRGPGPLRL